MLENEKVSFEKVEELGNKYLDVVARYDILIDEIENKLKVTYLRYKTITSQNMSSEAQIKNFFISQKIFYFRSQDIQVFVFLKILWFTESVTSR